MQCPTRHFIPSARTTCRSLSSGGWRGKLFVRVLRLGISASGLVILTVGLPGNLGQQEEIAKAMPPKTSSSGLARPATQNTPVVAGTSGLPLRTIRFYISRGLLNGPARSWPRSGLYSRACGVPETDRAPPGRWAHAVGDRPHSERTLPLRSPQWNRLRALRFPPLCTRGSVQGRFRVSKDPANPAGADHRIAQVLHTWSDTLRHGSDEKRRKERTHAK
jgi:hypothetical protein